MIKSEEILSELPESLRKSLFVSYREIASNFIEHRWEPSELSGGKFCEVVYTIIDGRLKGKFPQKPFKPKNMVDACRELEKIKEDSAVVGQRSLRIHIPRVLPVLYEIRNNRGVGHVGGEVDPNLMDATLVYSMASWVLGELIRIFHSVTVQEAQERVDSLIERKNLLVWEVEGIKRVLDPSMSKKDQTLLLLYSKSDWTYDCDLTKWVEYSTESMFIKRILLPLHRLRHIEYDLINKKSRISPAGCIYVEKKLLRTRL